MIGQKKQKTDIKSNWQHFTDGVIIGLGWAIGVTIGFVIVSTILVLLLQKLGGLPLIGNWVASIVEATQQQLLRRTPIVPPQ